MAALGISASGAYLSIDLLNRILSVIDEGLPDGNRYSDGPNTGERAAWRVIVAHATGKTEPQAREIIRTWVKNGVLVVEPYDNPKTRKQVNGLRVRSREEAGSGDAVRFAPLASFQWRINGATGFAPLLIGALGKKVMAHGWAVTSFPMAHQWRNGALFTSKSPTPPPAPVGSRTYSIE